MKGALAAKLLALADDELALAHRNSEWTGHAPILEEDIALANLAQDELGHAGLWYGLLHDLNGSDPDALVFFRTASAYRNAQLLELPKGDWAFTMLRQYLFDAYEAHHLPSLATSTYTPLAEVAAKILREERFHLRHSQVWVDRLGLGTEESNRRMGAALEALWPYTAQLFTPLPGDTELIAQGVAPDLAALRETWLEAVTAHLQASNLQIPKGFTPPTTDRAVHTAHLTQLLGDLQAVARLEPEGTTW